MILLMDSAMKNLEIRYLYKEPDRMMSRRVNTPFDACSRASREKFLSNGERFQLEEGRVLFEERCSEGGVFFVEDGVVKLSRQGGASQGATLSYVQAGELVGIEVLVQEGGYPYTASALTLVSGIRYPEVDMQALLDAEPAFRFHLMQSMVARVQELQKRAERFMNMDPSQRLAAHILEFRQLGEEEGKERFLFHPEDAAAPVGLPPDELREHLDDLHAKGVLHFQEGKLQLRDTEALERIASGERL